MGSRDRRAGGGSVRVVGQIVGTPVVKGMRGNPGLKGRLLENSIDAYVLALETINRLSIKYRVETFAYLICNAWELMLKAKIIQDTGDKKSIYYKKKKGEPRRSLALRDCLKRVFPKENDPTRRNIELVADLRDEATHLVISQVPKDVLALFQACVLNYHKRLGEWWGVSLSGRVPVGMMTIVYDLSPDQLDPNGAVLRRQWGAETAKYLARFGDEVKRERESLGSPAECSIDIDYRLVLTKKPRDADISLTIGPDGEPLGKIEVPKDSGKTHPYRQKDVVERVSAALEGRVEINPFDVQCIRKAYGIDKRPDFYYHSGVKGSPKQYSHGLVEWIVERYEQDNGFFEKARQKVKAP